MAKKFTREQRWRMLTDEQVKLARKMWGDGELECDICMKVGMTVDTFRARRRDQLKGLKKRKQAGGNSGRRSEEITEKEVEERTQQVQATWSEMDRIDRRSSFVGIDSRIVRISDIRSAIGNR